MTASDVRRTVAPTVQHVDVLFVGDRSALRFGVGITGAVVDRVDPDAAEQVLRVLRSGVVVVVVPPCEDPVIGRVARVRRERPGVRAMLVDPASSANQRLEALQAGFDEAVPQELGAHEIAARIAIQLVRSRTTMPARLSIGEGVELDLEARALRRRGRLVHLRPLEFRLLEELARAPGRPLSRAWLIDRAWGAAPPAGSRTIDVHVRWLREKVERDPEHPVHLLTVRGVGYQLEPDVPDELAPVADTVVAGHDVLGRLTVR